MILFWYTHWFWITILFVYSSAAAVHSVENQTEPSTYYSNNGTRSASEANKTVVLVESIANTTKSPVEVTTTTPSGQSISLNLSLENTTNSVIDANVTSDIDDETLATLETSNDSFNDSIASLDHAAAIANDTGDQRLSAAGITGITLGCIVLVAVLCAASYVWYRSRGFNRPQVLTDRSSNLDSSGYIDDTSVRDNSEEMYSLDNDSFLNSLEAMTIQNYWTDTVKHTKL